MVAGERGDIIKTMHRAMTGQGLARDPQSYVIHRGLDTQPPAVGRVVGKGLAGDELTGRLHLVIDGADGRIHYAEMTEAAGEGITVGSIVEVGRAEAPPRPADRNIAEQARDNGGLYEKAKTTPATARRVQRLQSLKLPYGHFHSGGLPPARCNCRLLDRQRHPTFLAVWRLRTYRRVSQSPPRPESAASCSPPSRSAQ